MSEHQINSPRAMQAEPLFAASLTPNRALSWRGFRWAIGFALVAAALPILAFTQMGAWPVVGFMGLDVLALVAALIWSMRDGRRFEQVTLWPDRLQVRQVDGAGREALSTFSPFHVRLLVDRDDNERTQRLRLRSRETDPERIIEIGGFLNAEDKASFAKVFGSALRKARG